MPNYIKAIRKFHKKKKRQNKLRLRKLYRLPRQMIAFPRTKIAKMRYVDQIELYSASSVPYVGYFWRANGIYDPQVALGGHQPLGYDQWHTFYNHYVVLGSKITVNFVKTGTAGTVVPLACCVLLCDDTTLTPTLMSTTLEQGLAKYKLMSTSINLGPQQVTVVKKFSAKRFFNVTDVKDNIKTLGASFGADPTEGAYFLIIAGSPGTDTPIEGVTAVLTIDYIVSMSEPKELPQSS